MSRLELASLGAGVAQNPAGAVVAGVPGTIHVHNTSTPITVFADETTGNTLSTNGTFTTDPNGRVPGWIDPTSLTSIDITVPPAPLVAVTLPGGGGGGTPTIIDGGNASGSSADTIDGGTAAGN